MDLLNRVVEQLQHRVNEKHQKIVLTSSVHNILLDADAEKLQRVITNLIDNAIKFSENNKTIELIVQQDDKDVIIKIKDAGMGIPKDIIEQLFTASITIKRSGTNNEKSNGLGLSICKQIIEAHSGTVDVDSTENVGSTFTIKLPVGV
jgi:signal transduction histidine kinase